MANRHYDKRKERELRANFMPPPPTGRTEARKKFDKESSVPFPGASGPTGRDMNSKARFPRIKDAVKKDY